MIDLKRLRELAQAATPGPWTAVPSDYGDEHWFGGSARDEYGHKIGGQVEICPSGFVAGGDGDNGQTRMDAAYIAAANPSTVLALVERLREATALIRRCEHEDDVPLEELRAFLAKMSTKGETP